MTGRSISEVDVCVQVYNDHILAMSCSHCQRLCLLATCRGCRCGRVARAHVVCSDCIVADALSDDNLADILLPLNLT